MHTALVHCLICSHAYMIFLHSFTLLSASYKTVPLPYFLEYDHWLPHTSYANLNLVYLFMIQDYIFPIIERYTHVYIVSV